MTLVASMLSLVLAASPPTASNPRPGDPGYSVVKAFAAIVSRDHEVDLLDLSFAFDLPELRNNAFTWHGPFNAFEGPRFSAFYDPPASRLGISKITVVWDAAPLSRLGKQAVAQTLTVFLKTGLCPSQHDLEVQIGTPMKTVTLQGYDGGPSYQQNYFLVTGADGRDRQILYSARFCEFKATYIRGG